MKKILTVGLVLALAGSLFSWEINTEEETGEAGGAAAYLKTGTGSRALAMGSAFTAISNDATATYWNPAGVAGLAKNQVALIYTQMSLDRSYNFVNFVTPKKILFFDGLGVSVIQSGVNDIKGYNDKNYPTDTFKETNFAGLISVSKKVDDEISIGGNLKVLSSSLDDSSAIGGGLDISALIKASDKLSIGIMMQDIYTALKWQDSESAEKVTFVVKAGLAYSVLANDRLKLCTDVEKFVSRKRAKLNFGSELNLPYNISVRCGLSDNFLTAGFGYKNNLFSLDYCYRADKMKSGDTNQITLMIAFGSTAKKETAETKEPEKQTNCIRVKVTTADGVSPNAIVKILQDDKEIIKDITSKNGEYTSDELPVGKYTVKVWQQGYLSEEQKVKISANKPAEINFELKKK